MQPQSRRINRYLVAFLMAACLFGGLFPFLNVDLHVIILTPIRSGLLLVCAYCLVIWVDRFRKGQMFSTLKKQKTEWSLFLFFVLWSLCGMVWMIFGSTNSFAPTEVMGIIVTTMFAFCIFTLVETKEDISFLLKACVFFGLILSMMAMVEVVIGSFVPNTRYFYSLEQRIALGQTLFSPTTVFYNPNDYAAFSLLCISIVCYWIIHSRTKGEFFGCMMVAGILAVPSVLTNSTLFNLTAVLLMVLTAVGILLLHGKPWRSRLVKTLFFVAMTAVFVFDISKVIRTSAVYLNRAYFTAKISAYQSAEESPDQLTSTLPTHIAETEPPQLIGSSDVEHPDSLAHQIETAKFGRGTIHTRLWLIRAGWSFFLENPIFGCGPGAYRDEMKHHEVFLEQTGGIVDPHFFYVELLAQYGGILFAAYMVIILRMAFLSLVDAVRELRQGCSGRGVLCLFMLGAFSVAVIMPSTAIRHTALWMVLLLTVSAFSIMRTSAQAD